MPIEPALSGFESEIVVEEELTPDPELEPESAGPVCEVVNELEVIVVEF